MNATGSIAEGIPDGSTGRGDQAQSRPGDASARRQQVVVVLGMHRSGTSLLANLLHVLGVELGENLLPADAGNEAGYWEQLDIYQTQNELLNCLGRSWSGPSGTAPFPDGWCQLPEVAPYKEKLTAIVRGEISRARGLWGFKDPRTSRLLPLWKEIFAVLDVEPIYLLAIREPASVVESVSRRDEVPRSRAELLWLFHNLDAVRDAGEELRLVVDYDRWFTHPREQAQAVLSALDFPWPENEAELLAAVQQQIRPNLRHYRAPHPLSLPLVAETYDLLKQAAVTGHIPAGMQRVDAEARRALALFEPWSSFIADLTRPVSGAQYSFIENFAAGRLEPPGDPARTAVWDVKLEGNSQRSIILHPPAGLRFQVPDGRRARLAFAVALHPDAWDKPAVCGCEFTVTVDGLVHHRISLDPANVPSDRRWHECVLDIPESSAGAHEVRFETRNLGDAPDYCWAIWREPRMTWESDLLQSDSATTENVPPTAPAKLRHRRAAAAPQADVFDDSSCRAISLLELHPEARVTKGNPEQTAIWDAALDGRADKAVYLQPPAELTFRLPTGARGTLITAATIHPDAWDKTGAGGCEFHLRVDGRVAALLVIDPAHHLSDRHWHEIRLDIPENPAGFHTVAFETKSLGPVDFRWALWRDPQFAFASAAGSEPGGSVR